MGGESCVVVVALKGMYELVGFLVTVIQRLTESIAKQTVALTNLQKGFPAEGIQRPKATIMAYLPTVH